MTQLHRLSSAFVKSAPHGKHADGQGLWLIKRADGGAQWVLRISLGGKRREMGLGSGHRAGDGSIEAGASNSVWAGRSV